MVSIPLHSPVGGYLVCFGEFVCESFFLFSRRVSSLHPQTFGMTVKEVSLANLSFQLPPSRRTKFELSNVCGARERFFRRTVARCAVREEVDGLLIVANDLWGAQELLSVAVGNGHEAVVDSCLSLYKELEGTVERLGKPPVDSCPSGAVAALRGR